jgi:hypothetical protein
MRNMMRPATVALLAAGLLFGCKQDQAPKEKPTTEEPVVEEESKAEEEPAAKPAPAHSSSIPGTENQLMVDQQIPEVGFAITSPKDGQTLESGDKLEVTLDVKNYRTGREIGQHAHIILDNEPYRAHYETDEPYVFEGLSEGTHTLRAFPARHYHLSLKEGDVFDVVTFHVKKKSEEFSFDPSKPYLTYSRPKGTYTEESAKNLLLDFYVQNVELGKDAKVLYGVDGEEQELTEWKPVLLEPLAPGEHEITLKLVDMDGNLIENGGYNDTTRKITVE